MADISRLVFSLSKLGIKALERLFKASVRVYGAENIPDGVSILAVNHFTRLETLILPYQIYRLTGRPVMSLAHHGLFTGPLGSYLDGVGAVSTKDPNRDKIIIRSLLMGEHPWLIFPEGSMVKDKKIVESGKFLIYSATGTRRPPHTGAAALALRTEFYRRRLCHLRQTDPALLQQQLEVFDLSSPDQVSEQETFLVPVNVTYYPIRSQQNAIEKIASYVVRDLPERIVEELQTEGTMLLSGVDIDITFGKPLAISPLLKKRKIQQDILSQQPILPDGVLPSRPLMRRIASNLTRKVMASIYLNTTVNYDHLIAYILKYYPGQRLNLFDLAERLYLATETVAKLRNIRFHSGLLHDQCVRLCRRYHQILADFLEVAEKSGVIRMEGNTIHKKKLRMKPLFNFHTIRRDNPYQVILNEVEFLHPLTRKLRVVAEQPQWLLRWRLRRKFFRIAKQEFAADYKEHRREGESKPRRIGAPTLYRRFRAKTGVLLVHGYMAAPEEVRPLATYLHQHGYTVFDWLQSVERGYLVLANSCEDVVLGGFSVGAALALLAATNMLYNVRAVFAINCAMRLRRRSARLAPAVVLWNKLADKLVKDDGRRHFVPNEPENPHINYFRNPISGVKELMELTDELSKRLDRVSVPALLIQSSDDPVVHPEGSKRIYEELGSQDKELIMFNSDRHGILRGDVSERVFARVLEFLDNSVTS